MGRVSETPDMTWYSHKTLVALTTKRTPLHHQSPRWIEPTRMSTSLHIIKARESPPYHARPPPAPNLQAMPFPDSSLLSPQAISSRCHSPCASLYLPPGRSACRDSSSTMPITHSDLSLTARRNKDIGSKLSLFLVVVSVLCGLSSFVLSLSAEASRSEAAWFIRSSPGDKVNECVYSGSGRTPLACAVAAFLLLAFAMFAEHAYMLVAVTSPNSPGFVSWATPADSSTTSSSYKELSWQACFLFLATWICFAIAEVLLMIGMGVESGHLSGWKSMRSSCVVIRPGLFAAAAVLALTTVFLGVGLYLTALKSQRLHQEEEGTHEGGHGVHRGRWVAPTAPREPHEEGLYQSYHPSLEGRSPVPKASASV